MDSYKCGACLELLTEGAHCTGCNQDLHYHCAGITETGYRRFGEKKKLTWRCAKCKLTVSQPSSPCIESESQLLREIRAISDKLAPLESLKDEVLALRREFTELKSSVNDTNRVLKEFNTRIKDIETRLVQVETTQTQVDLIQTRLDVLEQETNTGEQWARMNNVEIKGIPQTSSESLFEIVLKIGSQIQYPLNKSQINFITRVPTREKGRVKPIIACFCNRYVKEDFMAAARQASKTSPLMSGLLGLSANSKIYINDHLTMQNKALLAKAKKMAAEKNFQYVWVKHAKIHIRKNDTSHVILVKSEKDIAKIS